MNERRYVAISIKHSNSINDLVLWGSRTEDEEKRCFSGYSNFARNNGKKCELYSLEEFRENNGNGVYKTDSAVKITNDILKKYKNYDTVLVDENEYIDFFEKNVELKFNEENKQKILDLLLPTLQSTRNLYDLVSLEYDKDKEMVIASFSSGWKKLVNIAMDSGTAMIRDVVKHIV